MELLKNYYNGVDIPEVGDIIAIGGPRPVVSQRGDRAKLISLISKNDNGTETWKIQFLKNNLFDEHTIFFSALT